MKTATAVALIVAAAFLTADSSAAFHGRNTPLALWHATARHTTQRDVESSTSPTHPNAGSQDKYARVSFNASAGYLTFPSKDAFDAAVDALEDEVKSFKFDKGQTSQLLGLARGANDPGEVRNALLKHSPLSGEVLVAFLGKGFPAEVVRAVLEENIQFSEKVEAAYLAANIPRAVRQQVDQKRLKNIAYDDPALRAVEDRYVGYQSLRRKKIEEETAFLATGADPESPSNPANEATAVDDVLASLLNKYGEVKIGTDVYVVLPSKDVRVAGGSQLALNHIRTHGDIPRNRVPARESANGLPKASSPPPVDPGIEVEPNAKYNTDCGGTSVGGANDGTGRLSFNVVNVRDQSLQYYWDFGDGFVSYKRNPTHKYTDGQPNHKVTVTVYNTQGATCSPGGGGVGVGAPTGSCSSHVSATKNELHVSLDATVISGTPPYTYTWNFGDGTTPNTSGNHMAYHTYASSGTYGATVTIVDANGCTSVAPVAFTVAKNPPDECRQKDSEKDRWYTADKKHKFQHKLKLKKLFGFSSKLAATVRPSYKGFLNLWWPDYTACALTVAGTVYTSTAEFCDTAHTFNFSDANTTFYLRDKYKFGKPVWVKPYSVSSTGTAHGGTLTISLDFN